MKNIGSVISAHNRNILKVQLFDLMDVTAE